MKVAKEIFKHYDARKIQSLINELINELIFIAFFVAKGFYQDLSVSQSKYWQY